MSFKFFSSADTSWWDPEGPQDKRSFVYHRQIEWTLSQIPVNPQGKALDIGAGRGRYTRLALSQGYEVISIDVNPKMLKEMEKAGFTNKKIVMKGEKLDFKEASFDVVFAMEVTMHVQDIKKFLNEIYRVLKPGGVAFLNITNSQAIYPWWVTKVSPYLSKAQEEYPRIQYASSYFKQLINEAGFALKSESGFGSIPPLSLKTGWKGMVLPVVIARPLSNLLDPHIGVRHGFCVNFVALKPSTKHNDYGDFAQDPIVPKKGKLSRLNSLVRHGPNFGDSKQNDRSLREMDSNLYPYSKVEITAQTKEFIKKELRRNQSLLRALMHWFVSTQEISGKIVDLGSGSDAPNYHSYFKFKKTYSIKLTDYYQRGKDIQQVDLEKPLPFKKEEFDTVLCFNVLEHIYHYRELIQEMHRIIKPGGKIVASTPFVYYFHPSPRDYWRFSHQALVPLFEEIGFECESIIYLGVGPFSAGISQWMFLLPKWLRVPLVMLQVSLDQLLMKYSVYFREKYPLAYGYVFKKLKV